jgi:serine phosphatase RsbU (regulator of sigma subunit)
VLGDLNCLLLDAAGEEMPAWLSREQGAGPGFCTVCLASVTPSSDGARVVVSSAGHPLPIVVRKNGDVVEVGRPGSLLGVLTDVRVADVAFDLGPGDALVLFTDGITERRQDGRLFEEQLPLALAALAGVPADELARMVEDAAVAFGAEAPGDDMAVLAISVPATPPNPDDRDDCDDRRLSATGSMAG